MKDKASFLFSKATIAAIIIGIVLLAGSAAALFSGGDRTSPQDKISPDEGKYTVSDSVSPEPESVPSSSDTVVIDTSPVYAQELSFELSSPWIAVGHSFDASMSVSPDDALSTVAWYSSDETIASVDDNGHITALAPGDVCITARSGNVSHFAWLYVIQPDIVYLSPSNEVNVALLSGTNECEQMTIVAKYCAERLGQCGVTVVIADPKLNYIQRADEAANANTGLYLGFQASVESGRDGTSVYYHELSGEALALAFRLYERIGPLTPSPERRTVSNGTFLKLDEIQYPYIKYGIPSVIIAVEDPVDREGTQWMADNAQLLGYEIANSIMEYYAGF